MNLSPNASWPARLCTAVVLACGLLAASSGQAAVPGITVPASGGVLSFALNAGEGNQSQPDGTSLYSWGYGCADGFKPGFLPRNWVSPGAASNAPAQSATNAAAPPVCPLMQIPGPTLIVPEGSQVSVTLNNHLPLAAGNTSIIFAGQNVTTQGGVPGSVVQEAPNGGSVTYTFTAAKPGTYAYYSGTQAEVQVDMGLYGALIVLPDPAIAGLANASGNHCAQGPYSLAASAYDNVYTCYDREYLFQMSEASLSLHQAVQDQVGACRSSGAASCPVLQAASEPYRPDFFMINGRSMPDNMDPAYMQHVPNQPYNANPHMHPGENILVRIIGQGRIQHPFHIHGNHERVLARDGNPVVSQADVAAGVAAAYQRIAGPVLFTVSTVSGQSIDGIFNWTGKGLNWDTYGHSNVLQANGQPWPVGATPVDSQGRVSNGDPNPCIPDANGFDRTTQEWCADHNKPMPVTPPDPIVVANGQWYSGTPYLGLQSSSPNPLPPTGSRLVNDGGYAYMWHSHDEREITTRNVFPGGLMTMLIIDPPGAPIDETQ